VTQVPSASSLRQRLPFLTVNGDRLTAERVPTPAPRMRVTVAHRRTVNQRWERFPTPGPRLRVTAGLLVNGGNGVPSSVTHARHRYSLSQRWLAVRNGGNCLNKLLTVEITFSNG
jgi:hypothetical protein